MQNHTELVARLALADMWALASCMAACCQEHDPALSLSHSRALQGQVAESGGFRPFRVGVRSL